MLEIGFEIVDLENVRKNNYNLVGSVYRKIQKNSHYAFYKLGDVVELKRGYSYKSSILADTGIPMYNLKSIKKDLSLDYDFKYLNREIKVADRYRCYAGDLLMAITDLTPTSEIIGRTTIANQDGIFSMDLAKLIVNQSICFPKYLHYLLNSEDFLSEAKKFSVGNNVKHLNLENVLLIQIPLPKIEEQKKIVLMNERREEEILMLKQKIEHSRKSINQEINKVWRSEEKKNR